MIKRILMIIGCSFVVGLFCVGIYALICAFMWIWNISEYVVAARIAATAFLIFMLYIIFNIDELMRDAKKRHNLKWWDLS